MTRSALDKTDVLAELTVATAIAELVDHSLDAGATRVVVKFVVDDGQVVDLTVLDDDDDLQDIGDGVTAASLERARLLAKDHDGPVDRIVSDVRDHLGIVFHRLIDTGITIVIDIATGDDVVSETITATHPFGYPESGDGRYPAELTLEIGDEKATVTAHIWPARSTSPAYRLYNAPGRERQGLFVYLGDRLVQIGGWNTLQHNRPEYGLGRMELNLDETLSKHVTVNSAKSGVTLDADLIRALERVLDDGYMSHVEAATRAARAPHARPVSVVQPDSGLPEEVLDAFSDEFTFEGGQYPVGMRWRELPTDQFFEVDLTERTLWINSRFREAIVGSHSVDATDAALVKSLLFLLVHEMFHGVRLTEQQREKIRAWQGVLISAVGLGR